MSVKKRDFEPVDEVKMDGFIGTGGGAAGGGGIRSFFTHTMGRIHGVFSIFDFIFERWLVVVDG